MSLTPLPLANCLCKASLQLQEQSAVYPILNLRPYNTLSSVLHIIASEHLCHWCCRWQIGLCKTSNLTILHCHLLYLTPSYVRFLNSYIVALLHCVASEHCVNAAVGKLLVQSFHCQTSAKFALESVSRKICHPSKVCQAQITIYYKLLWYPAMVLPATLKVGAISIWSWSRWFANKQVLTELTSQRTQFSD